MSAHFSNGIIWFLAVFATALSAADLRQVTWTCAVPCETEGPNTSILPTVSVGWCGKTALTSAMIEKITPICRRVSGNPLAKAVRRGSLSERHATCETSQNPCPTEGVTTVGFACTLQCPGEKFPVKASVCATDGYEAWSFAEKTCPGAKLPSLIPGLYVCQPTGQVPCDP